MTVRTIKRLVIDGDPAQTAEWHSSHWLAEANEAEEKGNTARAEHCYNNSQEWLDRANELRGWN